MSIQLQSSPSLYKVSLMFPREIAFNPSLTYLMSLASGMRAHIARIRIIPVASQVLDRNDEARDVNNVGIITLLVTSKS